MARLVITYVNGSQDQINGEYDTLKSSFKAWFSVISNGDKVFGTKINTDDGIYEAMHLIDKVVKVELFPK